MTGARERLFLVALLLPIAAAYLWLALRTPTFEPILFECVGRPDRAPFCRRAEGRP